MGDVSDVVDDETELVELDLDWASPGCGVTGAASSSRIGWWRDPDLRWLIPLVAVAMMVWLVRSDGGEPADDAQPDALGSDVSSLTADDSAVPGGGRSALRGDPTLDLAAEIDALGPADFDISYLEMQVNPNGVDVFAVIKGFDTVPGGFRFAYIGVDGHPIVVDTATRELRSIAGELPLGEDQDLAILDDVDGVIGLSPIRRSGAYRVATDVTVVRRHTGDLLGLRETTAGLEFGRIADRASWMTLPAGADLWVEPAVGAFVRSDRGGVFELTADGVESVTPHEMVATNGTRWIEVRRVVGPDEYWVVDRSGQEWRLDRDRIDAASDLSISPDGDWVFVAGGRLDDDFPAFWGVETGEIVQVESRADRLTPVWAPDSSFVAELDPTRNCIWLNFVSGRNGCIVLDQLNVPALEASALVVY